MLTLTPTLTLPFVDVDRKGGNAPEGKGLSYRARFVIAFVLWLGVFVFLRLNNYFLR